MTVVSTFYNHKYNWIYANHKVKTKYYHTFVAYGEKIFLLPLWYPMMFSNTLQASREVGSHFGKGLHFSSYLSLVMISFTVFSYCSCPWQWCLQFLLVSMYRGAGSNALTRTLLLLFSSSFSCTTVSLVRQSVNQSDWYSSNTVDFYLRCAWWEFQPVHWPYWLCSLYFMPLHPGKWHHDQLPLQSVSN
jgi:hypothetical protein